MVSRKAPEKYHLTKLVITDRDVIHVPAKHASEQNEHKGTTGPKPHHHREDRLVAKYWGLAGRHCAVILELMSLLLVLPPHKAAHMSPNPALSTTAMRHCQ